MWSKKFFSLLVLVCILSCSDDDIPSSTVAESMYFPPTNSDDWQTTTPESLGWDTQELNALYTYLEQEETRAFLILVNGKIVVERYWNQDLVGNPFTAQSNWYWASAGKSLTAYLVGIAQEEQLIDINQPSSTYLGTGWTSMSPQQEQQIKLSHQLSMTTGLDYEVADLNCQQANCLQYRTDPGNLWYYHNAPYILLHDVLTNASGLSLNAFTQTRIGDPIGINGSWLPIDGSNVFVSTPREAARFGLLALNQGRWDGMTLLGDTQYIESMTRSSQNLNPSYGYLWWLNAYDRVVLPSTTQALNRSMSPAAPADMYSALGKNGQNIDIIPSENMVVIRMGGSGSNDLVPILIHDQIWERLSVIIPTEN